MAIPMNPVQVTHRRVATTRHGFLLLLAVFLLAYVLPLPFHGLWIPDETRYAQVSQEMLLSGRWASPHFMGLRYFEKPAGGYWFIAMGLMTKGFLALLLPVLVAVPYMVWQRRLPELMGYGAIAVAVTLLLTLPWALTIHQQEPDFWRFFFWHEHVRRFAGNDAQHARPIWYPTQNGTLP